MFEVGWTEMLVIAIIMIVIVGPKDLPNMLRTFGRMAGKARGMANDFRRQFDEALKEAELDEVKKSVDTLRSLNPATEIKKQLNPFEKAAQDVRAGIDQAMKPKPAVPPAVEAPDAAAKAAEPLKNGATDLPGVDGPQAMSATPVFPAEAPAQVPTAAAAPAAPAASENAKVSGSAKVAAQPAAAVSAAKPAKSSAAKAARTAKAGSSAPAKAAGGVKASRRKGGGS
jgi:sec-independent protein translocase protein TatB